MAGQSTFASNLLMARTRTGRAERAKAIRIASNRSSHRDWISDSR
jgi:hypothetical protein